MEKCVVCGSRGDGNVPLCKTHRRRVLIKLVERGELEEVECVKLLFRNPAVAEKVMAVYWRGLLTKRAEMLGLCLKVKDFSVPGKCSSDTNLKVVEICDRKFYWDVRRGKIRLGYNGKPVMVQEFVRRLESFVGIK